MLCVLCFCCFVVVGTRITARHFIPDQLLDVTGISYATYRCACSSLLILFCLFVVRVCRKGKGFAGGMKRWGFAGLPATHGVSVSHRSLGATGQRQDPGRVFKVRAASMLMHGADVVCVCALCRARRCLDTWVWSRSLHRT